MDQENKENSNSNAQSGSSFYKPKNKKLPTPTTETEVIDQELNKTDLGHYISENKNSVLVGIFSLLAILMLGMFLYQNNSQGKMKDAEMAFKLGEFIATPFFERFKDMSEADQKDEVKKKEMTKKAMEVLSSKLEQTLEGKKVVDLLGLPAFWPESMRLSKVFIENESYDLAYKLLDPVMKSSQFSDYDLKGLIVLQAAFILEKQGKKNEATDLLRKTVTKGLKYYEKEVFFFLGRLYFDQKKYEDAKIHFSYILDQKNKDEDSKKNESASPFDSQAKTLDDIEKLASTYLFKIKNPDLK